MGIKERREREKDETRHRIMDGARTLFVKHGYEAVSLRKIAEAIEYSPAAVYVHFRDKEDLIREMCREDFGKLDGAALALAGIADPVERIKEIGRQYVRFGLENPHHYKLMFMTEAVVQMGAEDKAALEDPSKSGYGLLKQAAVDAKSAGRLRDELTDMALVAQMLWAAVHGVTSLLITMRNDPCVNFHDPRALTELMVEAAMRGILAEQPSGRKRV